jgi:hypothetical protein
MLVVVSKLAEFWFVDPKLGHYWTKKVMFRSGWMEKLNFEVLVFFRMFLDHTKLPF